MSLFPVPCHAAVRSLPHQAHFFFRLMNEVGLTRSSGGFLLPARACAKVRCTCLACPLRCEWPSLSRVPGVFLYRRAETHSSQLPQRLASEAGMPAAACQ